MIAVDHDGSLAIVTLDRPRALNALTFELLRRLDAALDEIEDGPARAVIVTGAGDRAFCAGADVAELRGRHPLECRRGIDLGQRVFARLERLSQVTVAAINGYALGGGLELALACTLRVAVRGTMLGLPEIRLGLVPTYGGTQRLVRTIGRARAEEMILSGESIDADRAYDVGLVHRVVDEDAEAEARRLAAGIASRSLATIGLARAAIASHDLDAEAAWGTVAYATDDAAEGMSAFLEKRAPRFRDR